MTIEIADRLIKLRKKHGYSQEELADKLGLSRQAVSKWERAEASPDTDNLICLAKLYGVSLDELLSVDEDIETIVKEQVKEEPHKEGIHLYDDDGSHVEISNDSVKCFDKDGKEIKKDKKVDKRIVVVESIEGGLTILAVIGYILLGVLLNMWFNAWVIFFVPDIIISIARAIVKKNANKVNVAFISCFIFFFVCMVAPGLSSGLWHPMWTIFLLIPLYHGVVGSINKALGKEEKD